MLDKTKTHNNKNQKCIEQLVEHLNTTYVDAKLTFELYKYNFLRNLKNLKDINLKLFTENKINDFIVAEICLICEEEFRMNQIRESNKREEYHNIMNDIVASEPYIFVEAIQDFLDL